MSQRRDDGLSRRAAIAVAACAVAVLAWSEFERVRGQARAADVARQLARIEAALVGTAGTGATPSALRAHGVQVLVGVDAFGARPTVVAGVERP